MENKRPLYPNLGSFPPRISYQSRQNTGKLSEKNWSQGTERMYRQDLVQNSGTTIRAQTSNGFSKQLPIKEILSSVSQQIVEMEGDELMAKLRRLAAERDSLLVHLQSSQALQERTMSERVHLIKQVEDLQGTILSLDQERSEYRSKQSTMAEHILGLEGQIHTLGCKLNATEEETKKAKAECSSLRQLKTKAENAFSDRQRNLMVIIRELQNFEERKKQVEEKNDSLSKQVSLLTEDARSLQSAVFQLNQDKDFQRKQLDDSEKTIVNLKLKVEKQEATTESLQRVLRGQDQELDAMRRNLTEAVENLDTAMREKDGMQQTNCQLRDNLDKAYLDQKSLQRIVEGSSQEMEAMQKKLQEYITERSRKNEIAASKDKVIERLQLMVEDLGETTESLRQAMDKGEERTEAVQRKLTETEDALDKVMKEKECVQEINSQLRDNLNKAQLDIQALQRMIEESNQELEGLRGKLRDYIMNMSCLEEQLSYKDNVIDSMQMTIQEQEEIIKTMQQAVNRGQQELVAVGRNLSVVEEKLDTVMNEKEAMLLANAELRGNLDKADSDAQPLQRRLEECDLEVQDLRGKLQEYEIDVSCLEEQLSYKDKFIGHLELTVKDLQTSAENQQQAMNRGDWELEYVQKKCSKMEEDLAAVISEKESVLEETSDLKNDLEKAKMENQALQIKLDGSNHECEMFHRKLRDLFTECSNTKKLLSSKEKVIGRLQLAVEEVEQSAKSLQQTLRVRDKDLEAMHKKLAETEENLSIVMKAKEAMPTVNSFLTGKKGQLDYQDKVPGQLQFGTEGLELSINGVRRAMHGCDREADVMWRNSPGTRNATGALVKEDQAAVTQLRERRQIRH